MIRASQSLRLILLGLSLIPCLASSQTRSAAQINDDRARQGQFLAPPLPAPAPTQQQANSGNNTNSQQPRRQWREMTDSLLDMMAGHLLIAGQMVDDPLTTGFGNNDFVEPLPAPQAPAPEPAVSSAIQPRAGKKVP